jgi:hypothetical protein
MAKLETPPGEFGWLVDQLRLMADDELLNRWNENDEALCQRSIGIGGCQEEVRHYAFRFVAIERFGWLEHLERRKVGRRARSHAQH